MTELDAPRIVAEFDATLWHVTPIEGSEDAGIEMYLASERDGIAVIVRIDGMHCRPTANNEGVTVHERSQEFVADAAAHVGWVLDPESF